MTEVIRIAVLDDKPESFDTLKFNVCHFNKHSEDGTQVEIDCFTDPMEFVEKFDHDMAMIDIDLGMDSVDGFDVAKRIKEKGVPMLMVSGHVTKADSEEYESVIPKHAFKMSEILFRFHHLAKALSFNLLEILEYSRGHRFKHAG